MSNIILAFEDTPVTFTQDAYLNATQIAKHFNKRVQHYINNDTTKEYIAELIKAGIPAFEKNQLVISKTGSPCNGGGTWLHPKLSIDFARWLDADFAVWCDEQIENIMKGNVQPPKKTVTISLDTLAKDDRYLVSSNNGTLRLFPLDKDAIFLRRSEIMLNISILVPGYRLIPVKLYKQLMELQKQIESLG